MKKKLIALVTPLVGAQNYVCLEETDWYFASLTYSAADADADTD